MSNLYINKKIDNLGRIVIPKEIRKKLHILENESLDITLEDDKVIIKKSSDDLLNKRIFEMVILIIKKEINIDINIFNLNKLYYADNKIKFSDKDFKEFIVNKKTIFDEYIIFPFYPNGILFGGIIVGINDINLNNKILECFRSFIEKYLEE